mgnify:CR=1 FL=1
MATVRVNATGSISVMTGAHSHGQGHETVFAQVVAERLGIPATSIDIVHGDTSKIPFGMGSYGSRSLAVAGSAMVKAVDKIIAKGKKIAAHLLEAADTLATAELLQKLWPAARREMGGKVTFAAASHLAAQRRWLT